jgi:putative PIN family toxin of toxin-antitoxin system
MIRVVLDTNVIVSALLVPSGTQASVLLLALGSDEIELYVSSPILSEYTKVLHRPRFKLQPSRINSALSEIRKIGHMVAPTQTLSVSSHESDNRFIECAQAAEADYFVTGNIRHFPQMYKTTKVVTGRQLLEVLRRGAH